MFTKENAKELDSALEKLKISKNGRQVLKVLLERGELRAAKIAYFSHVRRELVYRALEELETEGLIIKHEYEKSIATFRACHPEVIVEKLNKANAEIKSSLNILATHMSSLVSIYNTAIGLPHVEFREGIAGLQYLYDDIIAVGKPMKLIRSPLDVKYPEIRERINKQRERQTSHGITVKLVTSITYLPPDEARIKDKMYGIERKIVAPELLNIPAQIIIYGDKVGITSFDAAFVTTIIDNKAIRETFDSLFHILWSVGKSI